MLPCRACAVVLVLMCRLAEVDGFWLPRSSVSQRTAQWARAPETDRVPAWLDKGDEVEFIELGDEDCFLGPELDLGAVGRDADRGDDSDWIDDGLSTTTSFAAEPADPERKHFFSQKRWQDLDPPPYGAAERNEGLLLPKRPSKIQTAAWSRVRRGETVLLAEQTGSGKTLAYLLPLLDRLAATSAFAETSSGRVRALVLCPTAELTAQVGAVARQAAPRGVRVAVATGGLDRPIKTQAQMLREGVDVLVATAGRAATLVEADALDLTCASAVVLDEVDVMVLDETFPLQTIGSAVPADSTQFIFVSATFPPGVADQLRAEFPALQVVTGPGLHRLSPLLQVDLVDCRGGRSSSLAESAKKGKSDPFEQKRQALLQLLDQPDAQATKRTILFCNSLASCRKLENALLRADRKGDRYRVLPYHSAIPEKQRAANLERFVQQRAELEQLHEHKAGRRLGARRNRGAAAKRPWREVLDRAEHGKNGQRGALNAREVPALLVCTDRAGRGVDFGGTENPVGHVVLWDWPRNPCEFLRRVGRTARAGTSGRVTALVAGAQVALAQAVLTAAKSGERLTEVPSTRTKTRKERGSNSGARRGGGKGKKSRRH